MTARDLLYGRQGGRWVDDGHQPGKLLDQIRQLRERSKQADRTDPRKDGTKRWPDLLDLEPEPPDSPAGWEDRARMADARQAAGADLDSVDREALRRYPNPRTAADMDPT